jgi:DNA-binding MarR family transcriptional regulator
MQTTTTAIALPSAAAALLAADRVIGSWNNGRASLREAAFILALSEQPGRSTKHYARTLNLSGTAVHRATENCYAAGLLTRTTDPEDRRRVIIRPTSHGERLALVLSGKGA